uniref:Uncharacterized protein n=1 Tax=Xenopus tropicalis TaxID=8364 RepID=A0A1B8Y570_XENTR
MNGAGEPCYVEVAEEYDGLCQYAQKITACFGVNEFSISLAQIGVILSFNQIWDYTVSYGGATCNVGTGAQRRLTRRGRRGGTKASGGFSLQAPGVLLPEMLPFPRLNTLGRLCGSGRSKEAQQPSRTKPGNSVKRMSIIEDGEIAEVLYLIPKQTVLQHMPYLNPDDYYLCEELTDLPTGLVVCSLLL